MLILALGMFIAVYQSKDFAGIKHLLLCLAVNIYVHLCKLSQVFLKSDSLCLMEGGSFRSSPTIPSAHILAMHIQQLETGGFTLRNGTYKWTKLRYSSLHYRIL